jgi:hypothetical protein
MLVKGKGKGKGKPIPLQAWTDPAGLFKINMRRNTMI